MRTRIVTRSVLIGTGLLAAVSVAACTGSLAATGTANAGTTTTAAAPATVDTGDTTPPAAQQGGTTQPPAVVAQRSPVTPECKAANLKLSYGGSDAGMSHQEQVLRFTNVATHSCVIVGFPGVSYVGNHDGTQVGAPAQRDGGIGRQVTLKPGQVASTVITSVDPGVFDPGACQPTPVDGYRIYAPDDTAAMFIALPGQNQGCAGTSTSPQLTVVSIKAGAGDPDQ